MGAGRRLRLPPSRIGTASAQTSTGGLRGFVKDETGGALAGVTVEASSPARIGGAAVEVTDAQGLYRFENLPIGQYILRFTLQGFGTVRRDGVRVEVGRTFQVDVQLAVGDVEQAITVTGESPVVDAVHSGITTNFNQEMLQNIPAARQSYFDIVTFTPSVKINQVPNDSRFIIFGSSSDQNQFQYHGVDISAVSNGGVWDFPSPDIMQEVQVNAIGASAEFHDFQGGVVNIVTKSGGNSFRGAGSFYIIPPGLVGNNTPAEQFPYKIHYSQQGTFELGGPLMRDRVWFYGILPATARPHDRRRRGSDPRQTGRPHPTSRSRRARSGSGSTTISTSAGTTTCSAAAPPPAGPRRSSPSRSSMATTRS